MNPDPSPRDDLLLDFLAERDAPCPVCGYNLRRSTGCRCPECGSRVELRVGSADQRLGPWVAIIAAASFLVGFVAYFFALGIAVWAEDGHWWPEPPSTFIYAAVGSAYLLFVGLVITHRNRLLRLERGRQLQWAVVTWAASLLTSILLIVVLLRYN